VIWEGSGLKPINMSSLTSDAGVRKAFRAAVGACHPDKARGNPEHELIADRLYNALNTQFDAFKAS